MWEKLNRLIKKIQNSDEIVKRRWLISASAVSMVLIITLWFFYIGFIIKPMAVQKSPSPTDDFWSVFKNGLVIVGGELKRLAGQIWNLSLTRIKNVISIIMSERTITFEQR